MGGPRDSVHTGPARAPRNHFMRLSPKRTQMSPPHGWSDRTLLPAFSACCVRMCTHEHTQVRTQVYTYMPAPITHTHTPCTYNTHAHTHNSGRAHLRRLCHPKSMAGLPQPGFVTKRQPGLFQPRSPGPITQRGASWRSGRVPWPPNARSRESSCAQPGNGPPPGTQAREKAAEPPF